MSSLMRWDPFGNQMSLQNAIDRLFEDSFVRMPGDGMRLINAADLAIDMYETKNEVVVKAALPGVKPDDVEITLTGDTLTIRGETKEEKEVKEKDYIRKERREGSFSRSLTLPSGLNADKAEATFENGVLQLRIPKSEESKPKSIKVRGK